MSTTKDKQQNGRGTLERWEKDHVLMKGLQGDFDRLLDEDSSADLHFLIDEERVLAHRLVVVARCERYRKKKRMNRPLSAENTPLIVQLGRHFSAAAVSDIVRYLYVGEVTLHNDAPFSLLQVCAEFGLPLLQSYLTRHVIGHLTRETVCQTHVGASSLMQSCRDDSLKLALKQIAQESRAYIITNIRAIFQGRGFLDLPKEMFIGIISSNELSVFHEEEVWHAVVQWGQHKAGVKQPMVLWTQQDRTLIQEALLGVLQHIRVADISEEVFTREVEPTGLLPMDLVMAHYKNTSKDGNGCGTEGDVLSPRGGVQEPFAESAILGGVMDLQSQLLKWIEHTKSQDGPAQEWACSRREWSILYRGSRDGFSARSFHSLCDDKGPTLLIVKTAGGWMFGGYSDISWSSRFKRGKYASSSHCFLFSLVSPLDTPPSIFPILQSAYAINNHPSIGPIFGSGADLYISSDCASNKDSYSQLGRSYGEASGPPNHLTGEQYFRVEEYEIFGLVN